MTDHIMALLGAVLDGLRRDLTPTKPPLRWSHVRLLSLAPPDGMRVSDLAERAGMSKQALGEFATALEDLGMMESLRDPADRRVRIVRPTEQGLRVVEESTVLITEVEATWRERIGARDWDRLRALLITAAAKGSGGGPRSGGGPSSSGG